MSSPKEQLDTMASQLTAIQKQLASMQKLLTSTNGGGTPRVINRPVIVGVKDITAAQLLDAYQRGLNLEQLCMLANQKYTPEQVMRKLQKMGVQ